MEKPPDLSENEDESVVDQNTLVLEISEGVVLNKSLQSILGRYNKNALNKVTQEKMKQTYGAILSDFLTLFINEQISRNCLKRDANFLKMCREKPDLQMNSGFWHFPCDRVEKEMLDNAICSFTDKSAKRITNTWRKNLMSLIPYFDTAKAEKELFKTITSWLTSPQLTIHQFNKWKSLMSKGTPRSSIRLADLRTFSDSGRWFEVFQQSLEDITTTELTQETRSALYEFLKDVFHLDVRVCPKGQDRSRLIIVQKVLFLSTAPIERIRLHPNVQEIHIYAKKLLFVDCDLPNELFHGKNLAVVAGQIVVLKRDALFDVSGVSKSTQLRPNIFPKPAAQEDGTPGRDGLAGESSGNVAIIAETIINTGCLTVKTCGGNGEGGQDGGPGGDGTVGKGVTREELDALIPKYSSLYFNEWAWFADYDPGKKFRRYDEKEPKNPEHQYFLKKYKDPHGRRIDYSFAGRKRTWRSFTRYELYFVVYGAKGDPPGVGGQNGVSGEGGREGEYTALTFEGRPLKGIFWDHRLGTNGNNDGKCGETGDPGETGNDMAFMDRSELQSGGFSCYIGGSEKDKLKAEYHDSPTPDKRSRFSGYLKYEEMVDDCFIRFMETTTDKVTSKTSERREEADRKSESKAVSQQTIMIDDIVAEFNCCFPNEEIELILEEISIDRVYSEEETEKEQQMEEELTVVRTQVESIEEHEVNARAQKPSREQVYQDILKPKWNLVSMVELLEKAFQVCIDCLSIQRHIDNIFKFLEGERSWNDSVNGYLKNGMNQEQLKDFVAKAKIKWEHKRSLSTVELKMNTKSRSSVELILKNDELADVISSPLEGDFWSTRNSERYGKELVTSFLSGKPKFWVYEDVLEQINRIYKELKKLEILEKFRKDDLDWSDQNAVLNYLKLFMTSGEKEKQDKEAEVAAEAIDMLDLERQEETTTEKQESFRERAAKYVQSAWKYEENSQFSEVVSFMKDKGLQIEALFGPLRQILDQQPDLRERFVLKCDYMGYPKPVGSHKTSLIFMRFFSEQILDFSSKLFRYHLKYRNGASTPRDWQRTEDMVFDNFEEFLLAVQKFKILPMDGSFRRHMEQGGLRSASYRLLFAESNDVNLQLFCESGYAKMRLVENLNTKARTTFRLFQNKQGDVTAIAPCGPVRRLNTQLSSCKINIPLPQADDTDLKQFVVPLSKETLGEWMEAVTATMNTEVFHKFLGQLFELRGFDLSLTELQFLFNTFIDSVCNNGLSLEHLCLRLMGAHGAIDDIALSLRIFHAARGNCKPLKDLAESISDIKDKRLQALFGSKLYELDWSQYHSKLHLLFHMLKHANNSFAQLEQRPLKEWIDIAQCQKWDSYEPLNAEYGTAGYFFILLDATAQQESRKLREMIDQLKKKGCFVFEKMISRLTYLIHHNELEFDTNVQEKTLLLLAEASKIVENLRGKGKSEICMINEERLQQKWIKELKRLNEWNYVFSQKERTLQQLIKLTINPNDSKEEKEARSQKMTTIQSMIASTAMDKHIQILAQIDEVLKFKNIRLRNTQKIAVLSAYTHYKNLLCQVNTGEGKSFIIASLAIMKIKLKGGSVDIITSSSVLAQRDAESMKEIYEAFDIRVGHNCDENTEERKKAYTSGVVYGDIARFERDHLLHHFYKRNILGNRGKDCVIVDEVDSMFLDNGSNMLYLSHNIPGLELLESLFVFIHKEIYTQQADENCSLSEKIRKAVLVDLFGMITKEDIAKLMIHEKQAVKIATVWRYLVKNNVVDSEGVFQNQATSENFLQLGKDLLASCGGHLTKRVLGMLTVVQNRKQEILIPSYLYPFVLQHLPEFVDSALKGFFLQRKDEYVVDVDRSGRTGDLHPVITIIDKPTGTDLTSSQWSEGLHQFLQLKHGCRLTSLSLKAVFVSNVSYLKSYANIYGFSGTLGSQVESDSLRDLYNADVMRIPTYTPKQFNENAPVLTMEEPQWIQALYDGIYNQFDAGRSVLLVCQSIAEVERLYKELCKLAEDSGIKKAFVEAILYKRDYDTDNFDEQIDGELHCQKLIISTNLAGRGTDIKLHKDLIECGGLHVIVSFLPENSRIEDQAYGRAARCGQPGSGQIIALIDKHASGASNIFQLKQFRDNAEVHRLRSLKQFYDYHIAVEEKCLQLFQEHCSGAIASTYSGSEEDKLPSKNQVLYFALLDEWAIWLDKVADRIIQCEKNASNAEKETILASAKSFLLDHPIPADWNGNLSEVAWLQRPQPLLTLALIRIEEKNEGEALRLLQDISDKYLDFAAEANYYMGVIVQRQIREHRTFEREEQEQAPKEEKEGIWKWLDDKWQWVDDKRLWLGNKVDDGKNWAQNQFQKINNIENSPEYFVKINEDCVFKASALYSKARALLMKRIRRKRLMHTIVTTLQQEKTETLSRGYAEQNEAYIAVVESFIGNIDDILGHVPKPSDLLLSGEDEHIYISRMRGLQHAGIISPAVLMDSIDDDLLHPVAASNCLPKWLLSNFVNSINNDPRATEYEQRKVVDQEMLTSLPLPSAIGFWGSLRRAGCFLRERFYIAIKKSTTFTPLKAEAAVKLQMDPFDLKLTDNGMDEYLFYDLHDQAGQVKNDYENNLALKEMMDCDAAYIEIIGTLNPLVVATTPNLDQFDFVNVDILVEELGLEESEAEWILAKLVDVNMLKQIVVELETEKNWKENDPPGKTTIGTCCTTVFVEETRIDLDVFPENMRDSIGTVFARHFSYGYALKALAASLQETIEGKTVRHRILLPMAPYADLFEDMLNSGVLIHGRVTHDVKEIYDHDDPLVGFREYYLDVELYDKLCKMTPWIKINSCKLQSSQVYMREKCVPASAEIRSALANGMRQIATITKPNPWRWFFGIFADFGSFLASCAYSRVGSKTKTFPVLVPAVVGSMLYFVSIFKNNRQAFAKANVSYSEEFSILRESHEIAIEKRIQEKKNQILNKELQAHVENVLTRLRHFVLAHSLLTFNETPLTECYNLFREHATNSPLLPMLRQVVNCFLSTQTRIKLHESLKASNAGVVLEDFDLLQTVIVFATSLIMDVNKSIRLMNRSRRTKIAQIDVSLRAYYCIREAELDSSYIEEALRSKEINLSNVLCKEMHSLLGGMIEEAMEMEIRPLVNQMMGAWREKNAPAGGELCLDEETKQKKSVEYSAERLAKSNNSDFMAKDLHNIFLKICFREQRPEVLSHMVRYNYPMSAHCGRTVTEGVLTLLDDLGVSLGLFQMTLKRNKHDIYWITAMKEDSERICYISLQLTNDCFYVTEKGQEERNKGASSGLFENLCVEVEEIAAEFSLGSDIFRSHLEKAIREGRPDAGWHISENWLGNEKILCSIPF